MAAPSSGRPSPRV